MYKKVVTTLCLLLAWTLLPSQLVDWGPVLKGRPREIVTSVVRFSPDQTLVSKGIGIPMLSFNDRTAYLERVGAGFVPELRSEVRPMLGDRSLGIRFILNHYDKVYAFGSNRDKDAGETTLYAQEVDGSSLQPTGGLKTVGKLTFSGNRSGDWFYKYSRDSSFLLIYANHELRKNEPEKYSLFVLGEDLDPVWSRVITLPYEESRFTMEDFAIDNDGNVFVLGILGLARGEARRRGSPNYSYRILSYHGEGEDVEEYEVSAGDLFLTDMSIDVSPKRDIICSGFYSELGTFSIKGSYYLRIGRRSKEIEKLSLKEFDLDFITMNYTEAQERKAERRAAKGKPVELFEYDLRDLIPRADGGAVLVGEQYFVRVVCYTDSRGGTRCTTYYIYNDIIVVSIGPAGEIEWATKVPKRQVSANDGGYYSSFATVITGEALYFVYNDNRKNLSEDLKKGKLYNYALSDRNGIIVVAEVDLEGNVSRKALSANAEIEAVAVPKLCRQVNHRQMFLYAKVRKRYQYGLGTF